MQRDSQSAKNRKLPILLMFSASYCDYCNIIKDKFLKPMLISGEYTDKVLIRVLEIDGTEDFRGINGELIDPGEFADKHGVSLTPTLVFFDATGREINERLIGVTTVDFYGYYLDQAINNSLATVRTEQHASIR